MKQLKSSKDKDEKESQDALADLTLNVAMFTALCSGGFVNRSKDEEASKDGNKKQVAAMLQRHLAAQQNIFAQPDEYDDDPVDDMGLFD